jgi:hypothetical protein
MIDFKRVLLSSLVLAAGLAPCIASAALGEPEASVQADVAQLKGSINTTDMAGYRVHEIQTPSGTRVREYVGSDGKVFAVAWKGPTMPNLQQTLGRYFDDYVAAAKAPHAGHHHLQIRRGDLVVESGGHMRAFSGRAYLPTAVPGGLAAGDIR